MRRRPRGIARLSWLLLLVQGVASAGAAQQWVSQHGLFHISYESSIDPVEINRIHDWVLHIETDEGVAVEAAEITIEGGMLAHDHGLPTRPRVTAYLGDGRYRVQGVRFHMAGEWQILINIEVGNRVDSVNIELEL